jgi:hypothetical protein
MLLVLCWRRRRMCAYTRALSGWRRRHCPSDGSSFRRWSRRNCAQIRWASGGCGRRRFTALRRRPLHRREGCLCFRPQTAIGRSYAARLQSFARRCSRIWGGGSCISCEWLPERALGLLRCLLRLFQRAVLPRYHAASTAVAVPWLVVFAEEFYKVGWEQPDHAPVALQPAHPP